MINQAIPTGVALAAFEHAFIGMAVLGTDGTWLHVNDALCRTLGHTALELRSTSYRALLLPSSRVADLKRFADLCAGRTPGYQVEQELQTKSGVPRWVRSSLSAAAASNGATLGVILQIEDIDGRHGLEATTTTSMGELQRSNHELEVFASVAAHDLQEPLRKIRTFGDRLEHRFGDGLGESGLDYLHRIQASAERMQRLIDDLLAYARVSMRGQPFAHVDLDLVLQEVAVILEASIERSGGRLELGHVPCLDADSAQLRQVFQNVIGNALKFVAPGRSPVVVVEAVRPERPDMTTIEIRDNGIGFDPVFASRIFEPFERLHGRSEFDGTGIGLAICRRIVERHGGTIRADSIPGSGTRIIISLPTTRPEIQP